VRTEEVQKGGRTPKGLQGRKKFENAAPVPGTKGKSGRWEKERTGWELVARKLGKGESVRGVKAN